MRILAIRGGNIASLERFEIDFCAQPLASAGIFAIVGPTGSGKSSILDAMCLSLYHQAPRMEGVSSQEAKLGGSFGDIGQNDIRNLIRRGTSTGFAETDFVGIDGETYRARWGYRAGKRKGADSQEEVSLVHLPELSVVATMKSVCRERNEQLTGLAFDQFTRTVLLSQGRFAEFLRAKETERSSLLEKLTGTEIYSRISRAVHERKVDEEKIRQDLRSGFEGLRILEAGDRGAREAELSGLESELPRWREERERARNLSEQVGAWIRERDHLTRVRTRSADLDLRRDDLAKRRNTAQAALEETRIRSNVREEEIRTAEVLDVRLESARVGESEKDAAFHAVSGAIAVLEKERTEVADRLETLASRLTETDTYLEANRRLGPVAADWPQCRTLLDVCATALREKTAQEIAAASADGEISRLTPLAEGSERRVRELETSLEGTGPEAILAELDGVESGLRDLEIFRTWMDLDAQEEEARAGLARADSDLDRDSAAVARLEESLKLAKNLLESTRDAASEGAQELRRNLVEGEPCPVCGSPHHPRGPSDAGPLQALLATHQAMVSDRGRELDDLRTSCARAEASRDQMRRDLQRIQGRRESAGSLPLFAEDPPPREASARPRWMERRREAFSAGKKALQDLQRSLGELGGARVRLADLRSELATAQERRRQASEACRKADAELGSRSAELDAKFGGEAWRPRWEADPKGYVVLVEGRVVDFRRSSDLRSATVERIGKETVLRDAIERNLAAKSLESDGARGALDSSREERRRLETERASVLEGMDAASARAAVLDRIHEADAALEASRNDLDACLREMEGLGGALGQIERSLQEIREALSKDGPALSDPAGPPWCGVDADPETLQEFSARILESHSRRTDGAETAAMRLRAELELDTENRRDAEGLAERIRLQSEVVGRWSALSDSVGSADGKAFRVVAQRFTLEVLLEEANRELSRIAPRYDLRIIPDSMHFGVADRDAFGEIRPVHTLSGGESFMVSLALALGLSHLAGGDLRIESLFIDEGFGTLDPTTLRSVMGALSSLHAQGRKVGVVTHVEEMKEQIDVRIEVVRVGPGRSQVRIVG